MKIIALKAENIKRLVAVEIKPESNVVEITGKNGQGKTSVLDCIWWGLGGAKGVQKAPIRNGSDQAFIRLDLGEIIVTKFFKYGKDGEVTTSLRVDNSEGAKFPSPQAMLDKLLGDLCFDPLLFVRSTPEEQFNKLRQFVPGVDFKEIEAANKKDYDERTMLNRASKEKRASVSSYKIPDKLPEYTDEKDLFAQIERESKKNSEINTMLNKKEDISRKMTTIKDEIKSLNDELACLEIELSSFASIPHTFDISALHKKLQSARESNEIRLRADEKRRTEEAADNLEKAAQKLTVAIEQREADKLAKIAEANIPVNGISFGENQVLLNGVPFNQASDAEQLRAGVEIAMALNPKVRVIRVRDGSLLDDDSMEMLKKIAAEKDFQIWIERVDGSGKVGFVIEDGKLKEQEDQEDNPL